MIYAMTARAELNLEECYNLAAGNYPTGKNLNIYNEMADLKRSNLNAGYYPEITAFGQAQYQSDVTKVSIALPPQLQQLGINFNIPSPDKDQYKIGVNINQLIWDGGIIAYQKDLEQNQTLIENQSVMTEIYALRQRVSDAYFGALTLQQKMKSLEIIRNDLQAKINKVRSGVENGILLESNLLILEAENLKLDQKNEELLAAYKTAIQSLETLIGKNIPSEETLAFPEFNNKFQLEGRERPEYKLFDITKKNFDYAKDLTDAKYMPKFGAFAQGAYGKPGLNMLDPDFASYYIVGLKASWSLWNWGSATRDKQIYTLQSEIVVHKEKTFSMNLSVAAKKYINEIEKIEKMLIQDVQIIELRHKIVEMSASQLDNGVITSTEYLTEFNSEAQAKLDAAARKIELLKAKSDLGIVVGR
ncbi:MAG: hypothetical protein QG635_1705 [Bacteroidota bacterium]|nr:hypothetical protein [Bacteroidota bacterium]